MAKVVVLGGGVAGLSAAHELVERGFQVVVYERREHFGGKARSYGKPNSGAGGLKPLPAEHGFRFFAGFYRHLPDTMKRIPYGKNKQGVWNNLVETGMTEIAREARPPIIFPSHFPRTSSEWIAAFRLLSRMDLGVPPAELAFFAYKFLLFMTSCEERRLAQYEGLPWWTFIAADNKSEAYQKMLGEGLTRKLVACVARRASTRTIGSIGTQFLVDLLTPGMATDRLLNGPTNDVWIDPWVSFLQKQGVEFFSNSRLVRINRAGQRISSVTVSRDGVESDVVGDYYVCAVPVEVMRQFAADLQDAAPSLANLDKLSTEWMAGVQFYLDRDVPVVRGHVVYSDAPWSLSSISPHQFWPRVDLSRYGDGNVRGILSVDVSDWNTPGDKTTTKPARDCTPEEIKNEVWAQIKAHLTDAGRSQMESAHVLTSNLDAEAALTRAGGYVARVTEPLLVNAVHTWQYRPEAHTEIPNLFLAADYVRTNTDLATMEGANEAARRAVNAILKASHSRQRPCKVWRLEEPLLLAPFRAIDSIRFKLGY